MIKSREEWVSKIREVSLFPNSPVVQKDGKWAVVQRKEAWEAVGPRIFDNHLDRVKSVAVEVLRECDPQFELEPDQRFAAGVYGKALKHSHELRKGLAETLALLGSLPAALTSCSHGKAELTATLAVREILADADSILWGSLNHHLPMLAEAAPDEFLDAVEKATNTNPSPFAGIYAQESVGAMGRNYMTGLLWALETLAWHSDYLTRVIVLLGDLAKMDPGGNWANRPGNSAKDILLPWHPQTCGDISKRKAAVIALLHEQPSVGWQLLLALLPESHGATSGTRKPTWREFISHDSCGKVTTDEYWEQVGIYAELALNEGIADAGKLPDLIERLPHLPASAHSRLLEFLGSEAITAKSEPDRRPLWEALVSIGTRHRKFVEADWAMSPAAVVKIEETAAKLAPVSPGLLYRRLFGDRDFDLYEEKNNYQEQQRALTERREEAVREVIAASGVGGVLAFAQSVDSPWKVGLSLGVVADHSADAALLPIYLVDESRQLEQLSAGFVWGRFRSEGWDWVDAIGSQKWSEIQKGVFFTRLPFCRDTWLRAERLFGADSSAYWTKTSANTYEAEEGDLSAAAEQLLRYGRARAAIQCLERLIQDKDAGPVELVIRALQANLTSGESAGGFDQHDTLELIGWLQSHPDTPSHKLFQIEWSYLPLLGRYGSGSPKTLVRRLAQDPTFFCEVIRAIFKSRNDDQVKEEASEERKRIAENAYRLLSEWRLPPGCDEQRQLDTDALVGWVNEVKQSTKASGHFEVAMNQLGQVLAYAPGDPHGLWIHRAVAEILNTRDGEQLRSGYTCERFNMRGAHGFTGGQEEREIAVRYREKVDSAEAAGFHRLATSLRELAVSYERDAEREAKRDPFED